MIVLDLRGFAIPGPARPTFVVPYFGSPSSNGIFVQEIDDHDRVAKFLSFDPTHFNDYMGPILVAKREIGEEGLVGFVDGEGKLVTGTAGEIRQALANYNFASDGSDAFFATEVMEFRGDRPGLQRAIHKAANRFASPELGMQWKAREFISLGSLELISSVQENELWKTLQDLKDAIGGPKWVPQFVTAWRRFGPDPDLGEMALDWLGSGGADRIDAAHLFNALLGSKKFRQRRDISSTVVPDYVVELALRWVDKMAFPHNGWVSLWHRLRRRGYFSSDLLNQSGMRFLYKEPDYRKRKQKNSSANAWMRVWSVLWVEGVERDILVDMLYKRPELPKLGGFYNLIQLLSAVPEHQERAREFRDLWLKESPRHLPDWQKACLELIANNEQRIELIHLALEWMVEAGESFHSWYNLWSGLKPFVDQDRLVGIGRDWLSGGRITMRIWPEVLSDIIEIEGLIQDDILQPLAQQWLQLGKQNRRRKLIDAFADRPQAYDQGPRRETRVFLSYHFGADYWRVAQIRRHLLTDESVEIEAILAEATWDELTKEGHSAVQTFIENQLQRVSVALILFGTETSTREWVRYEVMRSHQLGIGLIAIDIHGIRGQDGRAAEPGLNPLALWQVEIDGKQNTFADIYPTYDWVADDGPNNISRWVAEAVPHDDPFFTSAKVRG